MSEFIRIAGFREITPSGADGHKYRLSFETGVIDGQDFHSRKQWEVDIAVSGTLQAVWGQSDQQVAVASGTTAMSDVIQFASQGRLDELQPISLTTFTASETPPDVQLFEVGAIVPVPDQPRVIQKTPS